ncbi:MAG: dirigent protein [Actinomycetota bacterium]|jgi:Dirigent-like protein
MEFTAEFTIIGEDQEPDDDKDMAPMPAGSVFAIDQDLYEEDGDGSWRKGGQVGEAHGSVTVTRKGRAMCVITFEYERGTVMVQGLVPAQGKKLSGGSLAVTGGTGDFEKSSGRVDMESRNPKRWSFVL